jgi:hypothetical protein
MALAAAGWNSLEAVKLVVSVLTPIIILWLGIRVRDAARRVEQAQWTNQKLIERRLALHQELAPGLNDLLCFFTFVGHFRELDPPKVLPIKRELDKTFHANEQLFSGVLRQRYRDLMKTCFDMSATWGADAKLRASRTKLQGERGDDAAWDEQWNERFVSASEASSPHKVKEAYNALMASFAEDLGVHAAAEQDHAPGVSGKDGGAVSSVLRRVPGLGERARGGEAGRAM